MKVFKIILVLVSVIVAFIASSSASDKGIKVEIKHNNQLVYDTVLYESDQEAKELIEALVARFSNDSVKLESETVHGLYVFHIDNEKWKSESVPNDYTQESWSYENDLNSDSLLNELSMELRNESYNNISVEMVVDSIVDAFSIIGKVFREYDAGENTELIELKEGFSNMIEQIRSTKVVLIREED